MGLDLYTNKAPSALSGLVNLRSEAAPAYSAQPGKPRESRGPNRGRWLCLLVIPKFFMLIDIIEYYW